MSRPNPNSKSKIPLNARKAFYKLGYPYDPERFIYYDNGLVDTKWGEFKYYGDSGVPPVVNHHCANPSDTCRCNMDCDTWFNPQCDTWFTEEEKVMLEEEANKTDSVDESSSLAKAKDAGAIITQWIEVHDNLRKLGMIDVDINKALTYEDFVAGRRARVKLASAKQQLTQLINEIEKFEKQAAARRKEAKKMPATTKKDTEE